MYTVYLKNWHNNWSDPVEEQPFDDFDEAKEYADKFYTFEVTQDDRDFYYNDGCQTWVEDFAGNKVYEPSL